MYSAYRFSHRPTHQFFSTNTFFILIVNILDRINKNVTERYSYNNDLVGEYRMNISKHPELSETIATYLIICLAQVHIIKM